MYTDVNSSDHSQPFTSYPDSIVGWYKYAPQGNDVGNIQVLLHGSYGQLPVDASTSIIALAEFDFSANSNWTRFSTPFIYYPTINNPAYILCNISAGDSTQAVANSELKIDDLELIYNATKIPDESTNSINVTYLNDHLQFSNIVNEINYAIYNLQGQLMNIGKIDRYNRNVSITLESGIYFISIQSKDHHQSIKILVD